MASSDAESELEEGLDDTCEVCGLVAQDACQSLHCGHKYCTLCIQSSLNHSRSCPKCNVPLSLFSVQNCASKQRLRAQEVDTIFGTTFVQYGREGLESFHFQADRCWIKYDASSFPDVKFEFDSGEPLPETKDFENWCYNPTKRSFVGTIRWTPETISGCSIVQYEMKFDEGLEFIEEGSCVMKTSTGGVKVVSNFGDSLLYRRLKRSIYPGVYVFDVTDYKSWSWIVSVVMHLVAWFLGKVYGVPAWLSMELVKRKATIRSIGRSSFHFASDGSYVDMTKLPAQQGIPQRVSFIKESFDVQTRIFDGIADYKEHLGQYRLTFDESLETIVGGTATFFKAMRPDNLGEVLADKNDSVAQSRLVQIGEEKFGLEAESDGFKATVQYRLVQPWQVRM